MRCRGMIPTEHKSGYEYKRNCGKRATVFLKVQYDGVLPRWDNGITEEAFGFCSECAKGKETGGWKVLGRDIFGLRGDVAVGAVVPVVAKDADESEKEKRFLDARRDVLKAMQKKKHVGVKWEEVLKAALDEFTVEFVMKG